MSSRAKRLRPVDVAVQRLLGEAVATSGLSHATVGEVTAIARAVGCTGTRIVAAAEKEVYGP